MPLLFFVFHGVSTTGVAAHGAGSNEAAGHLHLSVTEAALFRTYWSITGTYFMCCCLYGTRDETMGIVIMGTGNVNSMAMTIDRALVP